MTPGRRSHASPLAGKAKTADQTGWMREAAAIPPALRPNNGAKTHPLTPHALRVLAELARGPVSKHEINPGVRDRFIRGALAETQTVTNPTTKKPMTVWVITQAGRDALKGDV